VKGVAIRIENLFIEQVKIDTLRFLIVDDYGGRALSATLMGNDIEEVTKTIGCTLMSYYEMEIKKLNDCLKENRKRLEEEKKLKHPDPGYIRSIEENIARLERDLEKFERKREALKKLLELLAFL